MNIVYTVGIQFLTLFRGPLDTQLSGILVSLALHDLPCQRFGDVAVESLGYYCQLTQLRHRLDAGDDGNVNPHLSGLLNESEVFLVVEEQLGDGILRSQILFLLQILHVHFQIGCFLVFLRIASHTVVKRFAWVLDG